MRNLSVFLTCLLISFSAFAIDLSEIKNGRHQGANISGGQPSELALQQFAESGGKTVINLRTAKEFDQFDEQLAAERAGLIYVSFATAGDDLTLEQVTAFDRLLSKQSEPFMLHCASGNRVGALMALRAAWLQGASKEQALAIGKQWGITRLEPFVSTLIDEGPNSKL